jgi:hypothetical protein
MTTQDKRRRGRASTRRCNKAMHHLTMAARGAAFVYYPIEWLLHSTLAELSRELQRV